MSASKRQHQANDRPGSKLVSRLSYTGLACLVYIFSTGPYAWVADSLNSYDMLEASETLYAPLIWMAERSELFESLMSAYLALWIDIYIKPF